MTEVHWQESLESVVRKSAEHALALAWTHEASQRWCASWNTKLMFPSIILSALIGVGSVGSEQVLPFQGASTLVGIASITVGILQTIQNYFAFAKRSESHRIASLQYNKLHALLSLQLSLPRRERKAASEVIDILRTESEKLSDVAPLFPNSVKQMFQKKFGSIENYSIPFILNGLERVEITTLEYPPPTPEAAVPIVRLVL
jgi:hypothetical protein